MAVLRQPTNAERLQAAQWFMETVYGSYNPMGVLFFFSILERWHTQFCQNPQCPKGRGAS